MKTTNIVSALITIATIILCTYVLGSFYIVSQSKLTLQIENLERQVIYLESKTLVLTETIATLQEDLSTFLQDWEIRPTELTAYAPLDPHAVEGMCYSGNPNVTASGQPPIPWKTAAASKEIAFNTRVLIPSYGLFTVNDRGSAITPGCLDICVETRKQAFSIGRQYIYALWEVNK